MLIVGAKGHAREILQIFQEMRSTENLFFFDNVSSNLPDKLFDQFPIVKDFEAVKSIFKIDNKFVLGLGLPSHRRYLAKVFTDLGGELFSIISPYARIGSFDVQLGKGLNIMTNVIIYNEIKIGQGCLLNTSCSIHHNADIGDFCEISPGARILGDVKLGNDCRIGSNAIILPKLKIGNNVIVGAGAVVTKNVPDNTLAIGIPATFKPIEGNLDYK